MSCVKLTVLVFCLMVNRMQFAREETAVKHQSTSHSRGILCELIAIKILRRFSEEYHGPQGLLVLAHILVSGFDTFQNAPFEVAEEHSKAHQWLDHGRIESDRKLTALEVAIISNSKNFLSTRPCQRVVDAIYRGSIVYTPTAFFEFLPDTYKFKDIGLYKSYEAPILDQHRLVVPSNRYSLEILHFVILLVLYMAQMEMRDKDDFTPFEIVFCIYTFGWLLDQFATVLEHGWQVYTQNLWVYLDVSFGGAFVLYFILRLIGHSTNDTNMTEIAFDLLAMGAPFLVPRLAFNLLSENMLFVSLREMMSNFVLLTLLAVWSFGGFLLASGWMSRGQHSPLTIAKWMLWLWFGLDSTGIEASPQFHWLLGPVLMISFTFLGNTLFLTILVSMLTNTFATITANTDCEIQYRRTVVTFEGVKSDALFLYPPPFNILALIVLLPLKLILTPRYFHKVIVYSVRTINFPVLISLSFWERRRLLAREMPNWWQSFTTQWQWDNLGLAVHGDLQTVFERAPPRSVYGSVDLGPHNDDQHLQVPNMMHHPHLDHLGESLRKDSMNIFFGSSRKESVGPYHEVTEQLHELFQEHGGGRENKERFAHIESSIVRMEEVFAKFCDRLQAIENQGDNTEDVPPPPRRGSTALEMLARRASASDYFNTTRRGAATSRPAAAQDTNTDLGERRGSKIHGRQGVESDGADEQLGSAEFSQRRSSRAYGLLDDVTEQDDDDGSGARRGSRDFGTGFDTSSSSFRRDSSAFSSGLPRTRERLTYDSDEEICPIDTSGMRRGSQGPADDSTEE